MVNPSSAPGSKPARGYPGLAEPRGNSFFVPAAKLARREGRDFVLDPMWAHIRQQLFEHIDGLRSVCPKPKKKVSN